jgi:outer membrane protein OmpA-like peptidoglycan-associated protein
MCSPTNTNGGTKMKARMFVLCLGVIFLGASLSACSISVSGDFKMENGKRILEGKKVVVKAEQPAAKEAPKPVVMAPKRLAKKVGKKIEISQKVMFDTGKATIKTESDALLKDVAAVILEGKEIKKIKIEGHTDNVGKDKANKKLSQQRADSVKAFLVGVGVNGDLLEAVGYGEERPIDSNDTDEGKEANRRVEFNIEGE